MVCSAATIDQAPWLVSAVYDSKMAEADIPNVEGIDGLKLVGQGGFAVV